MNTATIKLTYQNEAGSSTISEETINADGLINLEREGIEPGAEVRFNIAVTYATIKGIAVSVKKTAKESSEKTVIASLRTNANSGGSPAQTFTGLTPTAGLGWASSMVGSSNPINANITAIYVKNDGTSKIDIAMRFLLDTTPDEAG